MVAGVKPFSIAARYRKGLIVEPINPNEEEVEEAIVGETFIRPKKKYQYEFTGSLISDWVIDTQLPI